MRFAIAVVPMASRSRPTGEDRAAVVRREEGLVVALADGAGGTGGGADAATAIVDAAIAASTDDWGELLVDLDGDPDQLNHGQATAVVLSLGVDGIRGASVGDSGVWVVGKTAIDDLTAGQTRKPLVGSGASPFGFQRGPLGDATLLVASDGLLRYAKPDAIATIARGPDLEQAVRALVDLVRLSSGELQDDVSVVLCRVT